MVAHPLDAALADPWGALDRLLDGPLHPGGEAATEALLDRAAVGEGTRLLDVGCGGGHALVLARERGARAVGVDRDPGGEGVLRGEMTRLPIDSGSVDAVLAECVLCLSDLDRGLAEARRVLAPGGRLALSDVTVEGDPPDVPAPMAEALCLGGRGGRDHLVERVEAAGFAATDVREHREDLLAMRDRLAGSLDYEGLLAALGERGREWLAAVERVEAAVEDAVEDGRVGYVSLVATPA